MEEQQIAAYGKDLIETAIDKRPSSVLRGPEGSENPGFVVWGG